MYILRRIVPASLLSVFSVQAETHTVGFVNNCGFGTPTLVQNGNIISLGTTFTSNGPLTSAIAYLQTGGCGLDGENCTTIEIRLANPTTPGNGSSVEISLVPPHAFSVTSGFGYFNGCDGAGEDCTSPGCSPPFENPLPGDPPGLQADCQSDNVDLEVTFCD